MDKQIVWIQFTAAALSTGQYNEKDCAKIGDTMLQEWDKRFGDAAFLLEGQSECAACHKPLTEGTLYVASSDAVKFCNDACLKASGRED